MDDTGGASTELPSSQERAALEISVPGVCVCCTRVLAVTSYKLGHSFHLLRDLPLNQLAQVQVQGDIEVTKYDKFWGQGSLKLGPLTSDQEPSSSSETEQQVSDAASGEGQSSRKDTDLAEEPRSRLGVGLTPLGDWEYLLDR